MFIVRITAGLEADCIRVVISVKTKVVKIISNKNDMLASKLFMIFGTLVILLLNLHSIMFSSRETEVLRNNFK